jgi:ABC-type Mn2+/Zn2+ transport system permease subunit
MIAEFVSSWTLFGHAYLAGWLIAVLLSLLGVMVVARDQIFLGAAVSQAAVLGMAVALALGTAPGLHDHDWVHADWTLLLAGAGFAVAGALLTSRGSGRGRESPEAITGWVFLFASCFSVLLLARSPHGMDEVNRLLASTLIGATGSDAYVFGGLLVAAVAILFVARDRLLLLVTDAEMAGAVGLPVKAWGRGISVALGLAVGLSIHVAGVVYAFGCLVLPALIAKSLAREVRALFWMAPAVALGGAVAGFVLANHYDLPPAQATVGLLAAALAAAWAVRPWRARAAP